MTGFSRSPRLVKGGIVLVKPGTRDTILDVISLQYNPDTLTRTFQVQGVGETTDRSQALRLKGPPVETIKVEAELDAADQLEFPDRFPDTARFGIHPQIALLESLAYPTVAQLNAENARMSGGSLTIHPMEVPLAVFVWSASRIVPVRLTDISVTEEAFDPNLNPLRAKVSLGMRVLTVLDVGFEHPAGMLYLAHQSRKERLAGKASRSGASALGIDGLS
jgi:hypothetical protein